MQTPLRYDDHFPCIEREGALFKVDDQRAFKHDKRFVSISVLMPDKLSLKAQKLKVIVIHLSNDFGGPLLIKKCELFSEVNR